MVWFFGSTLAMIIVSVRLPLGSSEGSPPMKTPAFGSLASMPSRLSVPIEQPVRRFTLCRLLHTGDLDGLDVLELL